VDPTEGSCGAIKCGGREPIKRLFPEDQGNLLNALKRIITFGKQVLKYLEK